MRTNTEVSSYQQFWEGREYEHASEVLALKQFLNRIPSISRLIDIGGGYGRLAPYYIYRAKRTVIADPSSPMLTQAKQKIGIIDSKRAAQVSYLRISAQNISKKVKNKSFDMVLMVRILHYLKSPEKGIQIARKLLKTNGYLVIEFPNALHGKARATKVIKRHDSHMNITNSFHPKDVKGILQNNGFEIVETRSVSNIRSSFLKKHLPINILLFLEKIFQTPFAKLEFGPSIFILAKKRG